jgi:hypothetical protein
MIFIAGAQYHYATHKSVYSPEFENTDTLQAALDAIFLYHI